MTLFPFFENIDGKTFLVIGGGSVAEDKINHLLEFTENIVVIANRSDIKNVRLIKKEFEDSDIFIGDFVIGATNSKETNRHISELCKKNGIPVNIVDDPQLCTFIFPSLIKRGDLTIGISSSGKSPAFCSEVRKRIEKILPENTREILIFMGELRERLKKELPEQKTRSRILKKALQLLLHGETADEEKINELISEYTN